MSDTEKRRNFKFKKTGGGGLLSLSKPQPEVSDHYITKPSALRNFTPEPVSSCNTTKTVLNADRLVTTGFAGNDFVNLNDDLIVCDAGPKENLPFPNRNRVVPDFRSKRNKLKKTGSFQTSIMSFTKTAKPVATVAPQRSPVKNEVRPLVQKPNLDLPKLPSEFSAASNTNLIDDDDDDFSDFAFPSTQTQSIAQVKKVITNPQQNQVFQNKNNVSTAITKPTTVPPQLTREMAPLDSVNEMFGDSDEDEVIRVPTKRRRTQEFFSSDDETDDKDKTPISQQEDARSTAKIDIDNINECSSMAKDTNQLTSEDLIELKDILLCVMDEICDIIGKSSIDNLMLMAGNHYEKLQKLITNRKKVKDRMSKVDSHSKYVKGQTFQRLCNQTNQTSSSVNSAVIEQISYQQATVKSPSNTSNRSSLSKTSTPVAQIKNTTNPVLGGSVKGNFSDNSRRSSVISTTSGGFNSPIPCGDSFFEDDAMLTQSHANFISNLSKRTSNSPVLNMSRSILGSKVDNLNSVSTSNLESSRSNTGTTDFSFDYKICDVSSKSTVKNSPASSDLMRGRNLGLMGEAGSVGGGNDTIDDMFDDEDFNEEFTEELCRAPVREELPDLNYTPRRESLTSSRQFGISPGSSAKKKEENDPNKEFNGFEFDHSRELMKIFTQTFGLREFRKNQLQAINASLMGNDCFILMPTGGGKSLCYQLPALVTGGVSIIVSPLRALIQDQVQRLHSMSIPAAFLSSDVDEQQSKFIYTKLHCRKPEIVMLYVTPEKLSASTKLLSCLDNLYQRQQLTRFVIDEAHCVSQWGHDFRPDYKKLYVLREKYPGVPTMALTATATLRVRKDIIHQLKMKNPRWFVSSFNRPNLKFRVLPKKPSTLMGDVTKLIKEQFPNKCGIVYCLSRNECDSTARDLSKSGIEAVSYHAGLSDGERVQIQEKWLNGYRCKVICATIAFGMGIDKPDVRFVVHYSLPKSVEGYYQEAGRAGRDGQLAHCILYYTYQDVKRLRRIIEMDKAATFESKRVHIDNLFRMVQYCENVADCRRSQLLHYFGEHDFDKDTCNEFRGSICDNCASKGAFQLRDVTEDAKLIVQCVQSLTNTGKRRGNNFTLLHFVEIFRGSNNSRVNEFGHDKLPLHGRGKVYTRHDAERLFRKLVIDGILMEDIQITAADHTACYVKLGRRSQDLLMGKIKVELPIGTKKNSEVVRIGKEPVSQKQIFIEDCYNELVEMAKNIAMEHFVRNFVTIFPTASLREMAENAPTTVEEMKKVENLPEAKIKKYNAERFLEITGKYSALYQSLEESVTEEEDSDMPSEWESHYFGGNESTSQFGKKKTAGRKKFTAKRKRGGGSKAGTFNKSSTSAKGSGFSQYSSNYSKNTNSTRGKKAGTSTRGRATSTNLPGMMPLPQPNQRSFLGGGGGGMFFG